MFVFFVEVVVGDVDRDRLSGTSIGAGSVIRPNVVKLSKAKQNLRFPRLVSAPLEQLSILRAQLFVGPLPLAGNAILCLFSS